MQESVTNFSQGGSPSPAPPKLPAAGVIFDCDGLLVDTGDIWWEAFAAIAIRAQRSVASIERGALQGVSAGIAAARLEAAFGVSVRAAEVERQLTRLIERGPVPAMPGAARLLASTAGRIPTAVATNAPAEVAETALRKAGLRELLGPIVSAEQVGRPKPAPDVYIEACRALGIAPAQAIAFEDSSLGVESARQAGLTVVGVPAPGLLLTDADLLVPRLDDERALALVELSVNGAGGRHPSAAHGP